MNFFTKQLILLLIFVHSGFVALSQNYLTFTAVGSSWINTFNYHNNPDVHYSIDGKTWLNFREDAPVFLEKDQVMRVRGRNPSGFSHSLNNYTSFHISGHVKASGSIMSLVDNTGTSNNIPNSYCFTHLFENSTGLMYPPSLPAETLKCGCYGFMFSGCTQLEISPELHCKTLAMECYESMFINCKNLKKINVNFGEWSKFYDSQYGIYFVATLSWVKYVHKFGVFCCPSTLPKEFGEDSIPEGWRIEYF